MDFLHPAGSAHGNLKLVRLFLQETLFVDCLGDRTHVDFAIRWSTDLRGARVVPPGASGCHADRLFDLLRVKELDTISVFPISMASSLTVLCVVGRSCLVFVLEVGIVL